MQITIPDDLSVQLHQLAAQHRQPFEHHELTLLVERGDQLMLRKAEALRLLHERGYCHFIQKF